MQCHHGASRVSANTFRCYCVTCELRTRAAQVRFWKGSACGWTWRELPHHDRCCWRPAGTRCSSVAVGVETEGTVCCCGLQRRGKPHPTAARGADIMLVPTMTGACFAVQAGAVKLRRINVQTSALLYSESPLKQTTGDVVHSAQGGIAGCARRKPWLPPLRTGGRPGAASAGGSSPDPPSDPPPVRPRSFVAAWAGDSTRRSIMLSYWNDAGSSLRLKYPR